MYNVKDNAEAKLQVWLSSLATTLVVELGNGMLFPDAPFLAVLNKRDNDWKITKSEKVEVTAKDWDQFTVNRGYEWTTPLDFNAWDFFSYSGINIYTHLDNCKDHRMDTTEKNRLETGIRPVAYVYQSGGHHPFGFFPQSLSKRSCSASDLWPGSRISITCKSYTAGSSVWLRQFTWFRMEYSR